MSIASKTAPAATRKAATKRTRGPDVSALQDSLLGWFDRHRRVMPWRARKGRRPDPYHVWLSEIMLQQTTVVTVGPYFMKFIEKWPRVQDLAKADQDSVLTAWAGLGYYARARNLHKCAQVVVRDHGGHFPQEMDALLALPGVGPYTAAAIASIAFDRPAVAVDGNVERVVSRFFDIQEPLPLSKPLIREKAAVLAAECDRPGDFTQAFMELGATVCTPRKPKCGSCPWSRDCKSFLHGVPEDLPRKLPKRAKPVRHGKVFWVLRDDGRFLIHKRQQTGLYEGMYQLPTTEWLAKGEEGGKSSADLPWPLSSMPKAGGLRQVNTGVTVRHSLTHFDLVLEIWNLTGADIRTLAASGICWVNPAEMGDYALPTLMRKAVNLCLEGGKS